jgi:argininosuccinate lyase
MPPSDDLVEKGLPFRQAHELAGKAVQQAVAQSVGLDALSLEQYQAISPAFAADIYDVFDPQRSVRRRLAYGGTAPEAVAAQIKEARENIASSVLR